MKKIIVILFAAGYLSCILIDKLFDIYVRKNNKKYYLIDIGSGLNIFFKSNDIEQYPAFYRGSSVKRINKTLKKRYIKNCSLKMESKDKI